MHPQKLAQWVRKRPAQAFSVLWVVCAIELLGWSGRAQAFEPFIIKDIRVEGIQRTEVGTVFNYLPVKVGDKFADEDAARSIKALYATGFFKDVRLETGNNVLIVIVEERPAIASIDFVGLKAFKKDDLIKSLKDVGLAESRIFDRALLERAEQELKRQYLANGNYAATVTTTVTPLERNRVGINFTIAEGEKARIKQINIIGAKSFSVDELTDLFVLRTPNMWSWYTKNDQYSRQKLSADLETMRSFYLDRGYLEFNIDTTQVSITPDKQDIYITIGISEGEKYTVSSVKLVGNFTVPENQMTSLVSLRPGDVYSRQKMTETSKAITDRLGNDGFAFANVNAAPELDRLHHTVAFNIYIDPGRRVLVRRINIGGNTTTRDEVIRREFRQLEGAWYEGDKIQKSKTRVDNLGYFDEVTVETPAAPGAPDQVDVNMNVKEKPTGSFMLGAGYSSAEKLTFSASVQKDNIFGSGKSTAVAINTSKYNTVYSFSYTNPYYTIDGVSRGFDVYTRTTNTGGLSLGAYDSRSYGGGVRFGLPLSEDDYLRFGLAVDATQLTIFNNTPDAWKNFVNAYGDVTTTVLASAGWSRQSVDSRIYPTKGVAYSVGTEVGLPGGQENLQYYKNVLSATRFIPLSANSASAFMLTGTYGYADGYGGRPLPFTKNFYAGGIGSVRGYESYSLGPVDQNGSRLGGNQEFIANGELLFPMPGMGKDRSVRLGLFVDGGQVWAKGEAMRRSDLRYSAGISLNWSSPIGPLKFSFGRPLNKQPGDQTQFLQFTVGTAF